MAASVGVFPITANSFMDSNTVLASTTGVGLPPEHKPRTRLQSVVAHDDWGKATIYDLEPDPEPEPPPIIPEKARSSRKSMMFVPKVDLSKIEPSKGDQMDKPSSISESVEEFWCMPFFQSCMMATIIEDIVIALRILEECNNMLRLEKTMADMPLLLALKYGVRQLQKTDELDGIDPRKLGSLQYKINKLKADRENMRRMFVDLYVELSIDKCFIKILDYVSVIQEREDYENQLKDDEAKNKVIRKELAKQLRLQRNHHKTVAYEAENIIANLKSQIEDAGLMSETTGRYVDNWQSARTEQHKQVIDEAEGNYSDSTFFYKRRSDHESRVHAEVESLTNIIINETLESIERWMEKYDTDIEKMDLKIQIQKSEYQNKLDKRHEMEALYARRDLEMKAWNKFKADREKEREYSNRMTKSAVTVQAWWRGLLVRKQLGPYRKKKGKKK